jgi:hypothetical protein
MRELGCGPNSKFHRPLSRAVWPDVHVPPARPCVTVRSGVGAIAAAARLPVPTKLAPAATVRKRRRVGSTGGNIGWSIADVFVGGVLSMLSAWVTELTSAWLGLEPGRKLTLPLGLLLRYT